MVLDKASCDLLQYLMDQETSKTIMAISKDLKESRRKIYYHIDKINANNLKNKINKKKSMLLWVTRRFTSLVFHELVFT